MDLQLQFRMDFREGMRDCMEQAGRLGDVRDKGRRIVEQDGRPPFPAECPQVTRDMQATPARVQVARHGAPGGVDLSLHTLEASLPHYLRVKFLVSQYATGTRRARAVLLACPARFGLVDTP